MLACFLFNFLFLIFPYEYIEKQHFFFFFAAALGLRCCVQAFSGCSSQEILLDSVPSLLIAVAFLGAEHRFWGTRASVVATHRPSGRSSQALERGHSLWCTSLVAPQHVESSQTRDKPVSLALAGRFLFTVPPGKSATDFYILIPYPATLLTSVLS